MAKTETATLAGGCFWCLEAVFVRLEGVARVVSGYAGGATKDPTYEEVCSGESGHAEVVQVTFDPSNLTYGELLEVYFSIHDPTTPNRQGADVGTQYRSAIFPHDARQRTEAERTIRDLEAQKIFPGKIVTTIEPLDRFYPAEDYHQDYFERNPNQPYCRAVVAPKVAKFRTKWARRLKPLA